jgi:hypothetical protein
LILKRFERSEAIERLERLDHGVAVQHPVLNGDEIKLEEIVNRVIVCKLDDSGFIDPHHDLATRVRSLEIFSHDRRGRKEE